METPMPTTGVPAPGPGAVGPGGQPLGIGGTGSSLCGCCTNGHDRARALNSPHRAQSAGGIVMLCDDCRQPDDGSQPRCQRHEAERARTREAMRGPVRKPKAQRRVQRRKPLRKVTKAAKRGAQKGKPRKGNRRATR